MDLKRAAIFGAAVLAGAVAGAAAAAGMMLHGGFGTIPHHGSHAPSAGSDAVHAARAGVAALGKHWDTSVAEATTEIYAGLSSTQDASGVRRIANLQYGSSDEQRLDLFVPDAGFSELTTVLVYLGDEQSRGGRNVGTYAANVGAIGVDARYRRAPGAESAAGAEDVRLLLAWLRDNIEPYGGDPHNIVLIGNSAGAVRVATYLFDEPAQLPGGPGVTAAILSSGAFGEGDDPARTPLALLDTYAGSAVPILLWGAEYDVPAVETGVADLYAKLCRKYADCPTFVQWQGHNQLSPVLSIDTADTGATDSIMRFYHRVIDARASHGAR